MEGGRIGSDNFLMNILERAKETLLLGKAVRSDSDKHPDEQWGVVTPDAWYVRTAIGDDAISEFINRIPYPLSFVGWMRHLKKQPIKWYDFNRINRRK